MSGRNVQFVNYITRDPKFLRNLYKLGVSAREKREAGFHVHLFPNKEYGSSEVYFGGIAHLPAAVGICSTARETMPPVAAAEKRDAAKLREKSFEHITKVLDIHCHSILKRASWKDFFSDHDFDPMLSGVAIGLLTAPLYPPGLGLLMAQPNGSLIKVKRERLQALYWEALLNFQIVFSLFREKGAKFSPGIWMAGASEAFKLTGLAATAVAYAFPPDCSEADFISMNTVKEALAGPLWKGRHGGALSSFIPGQNTENDRLMWLIREESDAREVSPAGLRRSLGDVCKSYHVLNGQRTAISLEEYFNAAEEECQRITELLSKKILIVPWEGIELSRQIMNRISIADYLEFKAEDILDWKIKKEDAAKIQQMPLLGVTELVVLSEVSQKKILRLIKQGDIKPDFTVTSGENTSYFFLAIPPALAIRGK